MTPHDENNITHDEWQKALDDWAKANALADRFAPWYLGLAAIAVLCAIVATVAAMYAQ